MVSTTRGLHETGRERQSVDGFADAAGVGFADAAGVAFADTAAFVDAAAFADGVASAIPSALESLGREYVVGALVVDGVTDALTGACDGGGAFPHASNAHAKAIDAGRPLIALQ